MSVSASRLICNVSADEKDGLLASFYSQQPANQGVYFRGDVNRLEFYPVRSADGNSTLFWLPESIPVDQLFLGIGDADLPPEGGTFGLSYSGNSTGLTALSYAITAADLLAALNANAAITSAGGIDAVLPLSVGVYQVNFSTVGVKALMLGNPALLAPECNVFISRAQTGDADTKEVQIIELVQRPYVYVTSWEQTTGATAVVQTLRPGGVSAKAMFDVEISPLPYAGSFTVGDSGPMAYNGSEANWQTAIGTGWTLLKTGDCRFTIERTANGAFSLSESDIDVTGLSVYTGLVGTLGFNAGTLFKRFIAEAGKSFTSTLQVRSIDGTYKETLLFVPVTLTKDILTAGALAPSNWNGGFYTKAEILALLAALKSYTALSTSSAETIELTRTSVDSIAETFALTVGAGGGTYTTGIELSTADCDAGAVWRIRLAMPASSNPTIRFYSGTTGPVEIYSPGVAGTGAAFTALLSFTFNGTAWESDQ